MARCGMVTLSPLLAPTAQRDVFGAGNVGWSSSPLHGLVLKGGVIRLVGLDNRRCRPSRASSEENSDNVSPGKICSIFAFRNSLHVGDFCFLTRT